MRHNKILNSAIFLFNENGVKNQSPHPEFNILFITNFQIPGKGTVIPDIRKTRYLQEIVIVGNRGKWDSEVHKNSSWSN